MFFSFFHRFFELCFFFHVLGFLISKVLYIRSCQRQRAPRSVARRTYQPQSYGVCEVNLAIQKGRKKQALEAIGIEFLMGDRSLCATTGSSTLVLEALLLQQTWSKAIRKSSGARVASPVRHDCPYGFSSPRLCRHHPRVHRGAESC